MSLTSKGITSDGNIERGKEVESDLPGTINLARLGPEAPCDRLKFMIETYCRSKYFHNAILIPKHDALDKLDGEICRRAAKSLLRSKERAVTDKKTRRVYAIWQIPDPMLLRWKEAACFVRKCRTSAKYGPTRESELGCVTFKAAQHARRTLMLMKRDGVQPLLDEAMKAKWSKVDYKKALLDDWNRREVEVEGLGNRVIPHQSRIDRFVPVAQDPRVGTEVRRLALKWYLGRYPIPKENIKVPSRLNAGIRNILQKVILTPNDIKKLSDLMSKTEEFTRNYTKR